MKALDDTSLGEMKSFIDHLFPDGWTCIYDALYFAITDRSMLYNRSGGRIVLASDGVNEGSCKKTLSTVESLMIQKKIQLFAIDLHPKNVESGIDANVKNLALTTGGNVIDINDDLKAIKYVEALKEVAQGDGGCDDECIRDCKVQVLRYCYKTNPSDQVERCVNRENRGFCHKFCERGNTCRGIYEMLNEEITENLQDESNIIHECKRRDL
eukprot:TRINITY_DN82147_c0_g1_i1.p1 TRINITY_DN82147_c0_g1~~TRINITY_DN82147_c0_g1_i1.p1  ORF type:complete len:231 (-),score=9.89 TRINITY_DN82147_c0_g1_i1:98-733(-)